VVSRQGFQAQLVDELTIATDLPQIVFNEGIGGDWSIQTDQDRIDSILERHPGASAMLLLIGTNDALSNRSDADFDGNLRNIVNTALIDVDRVYIARILPVLNSGSLNLGSTVNLAIADYNTRIEQLAANPSDNIYLGPDFFTLFSGDLSLYRDDLHPNDSGYGEMASAWVATIMN
jgi:lysophospholipase L1-like esterase